MRIDDFIFQIISNETRTIKVYSTSTHTLYAEKQLQALVDENREYYNIANIFGIYNMLKWAKLARKNIGIDVDTLKEAIDNNDEFYGITTHKKMSFQLQSLKITDEIIDKVDEIIALNNQNKPFIEVIDDLYNNVSTSKYLMSKNFRKCMETIFEEYFDVFDELTSRFKEIVENVDEEIACTFHDSENLILILKEIREKGFTKMNDHYDVNCKETYRYTVSVINELKNYPFCNDVYKIINLSFLGYSENAISNKIKKSRNYVKNRYQNGLEALKFIIFGCSF